MSTPTFQGQPQFGTFNREVDARLQASLDAAFARSTLAQDDAGRAAAGKVTVVAVVSFTLVEDDDGGLPNERIIQAGQELEISAYDLERYKGRVWPKLPDGGETNGR